MNTQNGHCESPFAAFPLNYKVNMTTTFCVKVFPCTPHSSESVRYFNDQPTQDFLNELAGGELEIVLSSGRWETHEDLSCSTESSTRTQVFALKVRENEPENLLWITSQSHEKVIRGVVISVTTVTTGMKMYKALAMPTSFKCEPINIILDELAKVEIKTYIPPGSCGI
jgi:hypothetical protein